MIADHDTALVIAYDRLIRDTPAVNYYATFDNVKVGVIEANYPVKRLGLKLITGQNAEADSVKAIIAGTQSETVYKGTRELAKVAVQMTNSLVSSGEPRVNDTTQYTNGIKTIPTFPLQPVGVDRRGLLGPFHCAPD